MDLNKLSGFSDDELIKELFSRHMFFACVCDFEETHEGKKEKTVATGFFHKDCFYELVGAVAQLQNEILNGTDQNKGV